MLPTTADAVRAMLKADPSLTPSDRARIMSAVRNHGKEAPAEVDVAARREPRVLPRAEVARRFNRSLRFVDKPAVQGVLRRVTLPGRQRACGFLAEEVERVMAGEGVAATSDRRRLRQCRVADRHRSEEIRRSSATVSPGADPAHPPRHRAFTQDDERLGPGRGRLADADPRSHTGGTAPKRIPASGRNPGSLLPQGGRRQRSRLPVGVSSAWRQRPV